jgi:beta-lactamase regulating signal transducer with metallopeptidase domain
MNSTTPTVSRVKGFCPIPQQMVNKNLSEIRPGKELWNIKEMVTKLWIYFCLIAFFIVFLQIINDDEKRNHKSNSKRLAKMTWVAKFWGKKSQKHSSNRLVICPTSYPD